MLNYKKISHIMNKLVIENLMFKNNLDIKWNKMK